MIDSQLSQIKEKKDNNIAMLDGLALIIMMDDFYHFLLIVKKILQNKIITSRKNYSKRR